MVDFKKLDEMDILISSRPLTEEERKAFSEFLRKKKEKRKRTGSYSRPEDSKKGLSVVREPKANYSTRRLPRLISTVVKSKSNAKARATHKRVK